MTFDEWWNKQPRISGSGKDIARTVWHAAVAEERERCAKIAEMYHHEDETESQIRATTFHLRKGVAAAIRSQGEGR